MNERTGCEAPNVSSVLHVLSLSWGNWSWEGETSNELLLSPNGWGLEISAAPAVTIPLGSLRQPPNCGLTNGNNYRIAFLVRPCAMVETNLVEWPQTCDSLHLGTSLLLSRSGFVSPEKSKIDISDANPFPSTETKLKEQVRKAGLLSRSIFCKDM